MLLKLKLWLISVSVFVVLLASSWFGGRKSAQNDIKEHDLETYKETRKRIDEISRPLDGDDAREWLREHSK